MIDFSVCVTLAAYIKMHGRQQASADLDYLPQTLDKMSIKGALVIDGKIYSPVVKRVTRNKK